ncbi:MAG: GntR family transcriptional regulator [Planctomycetes bacterium]|nr:GntR family transcriptional regulator [Planctomycetota bacterium]
MTAVETTKQGVKRSPDNGTRDDHRRLGTASARVYEALRRQILDGGLAPGTRLSHRTIADAMHTSNGPVIVALRRLAHDGLITYQPSLGGVVAEFSNEKLQDLMTVRRALETEAARLAARRAAPEDIERLFAIVYRMGEIVRHQRWNEADAVDVELHELIARLSRSPGLIEALGRCHLLEVVRRRLLASERQRDFVNLEVNHRRLVEAIASGDPDGAGQAMHAHLSRSAKRTAVPQSDGKDRSDS